MLFLMLFLTLFLTIKLYHISSECQDVLYIFILFHLFQDMYILNREAFKEFNMAYKVIIDAGHGEPILALPTTAERKKTII